MRSNHNRIKYLLVAIMMTTMIAMLIWTFSSVNVSAESGTVENLQTENKQLLQTLSKMQARESEFRTLIQKANATIFQLIDQPEPTAPTLNSLQAANQSLQKKVTLLEQQLKQLQVPTQSSFSPAPHHESKEDEHDEHEEG